MNAAQSARLAQIAAELERFKGEVEALHDDEEAAYDARSERSQESEKGEAHRQLVEALEGVAENIGVALSYLNDDIEPKPGNVLGKAEALSGVLRDHYSTKRCTQASYRRVCKCLDALGLQASDKEEALQILQYHDAMGQPFAWVAQPRRAAT